MLCSNTSVDTDGSIDRNRFGKIVKSMPSVAIDMDCPRCSATLKTYTLEGHQAEVCESCGYAGVAVDHASEPEEFESWQDALARFRGE